MHKPDAQPFSVFIASRFHDEAEALSHRWIESLSNRLGVSPSRLLPSDALIDHIPEIVRGIGDFVRIPVEGVKADVVGRLRLLAQLRREQGYDIAELLVEFEDLSKLVSEFFIDAVDAYPGELTPHEVGTVSARIREGLAGITSVTVGTFRQEEQEQQRELAARMSEFADSLAHEMKTPLNAASLAMEMMDERVPEDDRVEFRELVKRNLRRTTDLLSDLRLLALSEGAQAEERWVSITQALKDVLHATEELARDRDVQMRISEDLPDIDVDAARVEIALVNLVSNGIKYSDPDKEHRWVRISMSRPPGEIIGDGWRISVEDNGLGIPDGFKNKVFQRHFRAHPKAAQGTGLGLAITQNVVVQNGGRITFESTEGEGTVFHVDISERQRQSQHEGKNVP